MGNTLQNKELIYKRIQMLFATTDRNLWEFGSVSPCECYLGILLTVSCVWHTGSRPILAFIICIFTFLMSPLSSKYDSLLIMADCLVQTLFMPFMIVRLSCLFTFQPVSFGIFSSCLFGSFSCGCRFFFICSW